MDRPETASAENSARFNDSLERCTGSAGFLDDFYRRFLAASPEVARRFAATDMALQARALRVSLYLMMSAAWADEGNDHLDRIAERHSRRGLDIPAPLYEVWLECLVEAVAEHDPAFSTEVADAWRAVLTPGIAFMRARF